MDQHPRPPYPIHSSVASRLDPSFKAFYNTHLINAPLAQDLPLSVSRAGPGGPAPAIGPSPPLSVGSVITNSTIPRTSTIGPPIPIRIYSPPEEEEEEDEERKGEEGKGHPVIIYFHGGGWVFGSLSSEETLQTHLCVRARCVVVSVDYRLAPEDPFPAAYMDGWEVVEWATGEGGKGVLRGDGVRFGLAGTSAGGNLAAGLAQLVVDRGGLGSSSGAKKKKIGVVLLAVPVLDNTAGIGDERYPSWLENRLVPMLSADKMLWYRGHYLPDENDRTRAEASPLLWEGDWGEYPRTCLVLAGVDVLRSEGEVFARRLREAGVGVDLHVMEGQPHAFIGLDGVLEAGRTAITVLCDALRGAMYPSGSHPGDD